MSYEVALIVTSMLAAMSCAVPGLWLVLRRHSMMGDALAHTSLLGVVAALLVVAGLEAAGLVDPTQTEKVADYAFLAGAVLVGVGTAYLTELLTHSARVEPGAALGVVFSSLFALGLFLVRFAADDVHIDVECVLFGVMESTVAWDTIGESGVPRAALINGIVLVANLALTGLCYKELKLSAFDPDFGRTQGLSSGLTHYGLMTAAAVTVVAAFKTVGSILVVGLLVVPAATAILLCYSLRSVIAITLLMAAVSAILARVLCRTLPSMTFSDWGVEDVSTAGMMGVSSGLLFLIAWLFSGRGGLVTDSIRRLSHTVDVAAEDLLGILYRLDERDQKPSKQAVADVVAQRYDLSRFVMKFAASRLRDRGLVVLDGNEWQLTTPGREAAASLVRKHRLWEVYLAKHFALPEDHLHEAAHRVEHFIGDPIEKKLVAELDDPWIDPHGRAIPESD